jgi:hypothetical protein
VKESYGSGGGGAHLSEVDADDRRKRLSARAFFLLAQFTTFLCRTVLCVAMVLYASFTATEEMQGGREGGAQFAAHQQATQRSRRAAILRAHSTDPEIRSWQAYFRAETYH